MALAGCWGLLGWVRCMRGLAILPSPGGLERLALLSEGAQ